MPEQPQSSVSRPPEQWTIRRVSVDQPADHTHQYKLVELVSSRGRLGRGLVCTDCNQLEVIPERSWQSHGQRVERAT